MDKRTLQEKLNQPYDTENWKEIVQYVFPNVQLFTAPQKFYVPNEKVESFSQLGNVRLNDGKNLALFELTLKHNVNILRNRVELNNLVSQFIDQEQTHGVLSVFEQGQDDYRFTFSAKATEFNEEDGDFAVRRTDTKRFTYVLGKNESCRTPAERLFSLAEKKEEADIKAIQDAFSVEKLSKEFFNGYKEHYLHFVQHITGKRPQKVNNKWEDKVVHAPSPMLQYIFNGNEKNVRDFVKLMLGRLVFIHFVQKKRWLGVPAEQEGWQNGDPNFLFNGFKEFEHKDLFYSHFLEPLFNEALNKDNRPGDVFAVTGTKVPYLNGGLFEIGEVDVSAVDFPAALFEELLEFFNRFNFTIDESDLSEREVGIDPEMLGHIFENLLEDNKDKGAFYTPKEIVHYMCQESLKEYLKTKLEEESLWPKDEEEANSLEQALEAFIKRKEAGLVIDFDKALATALRDVKICDPAIGSGAFPMGLLNEIYHCMFTLYHASPDVVGDVWGMNSWEPDTVKKNIIQNSIYGVDIEKGAVDIARLRFWLSLLIEEETPNPLPNLDYKIVVGNSLVSKLGNEIIDIDWSLNETSHGLFGNEFELRKIELLKKISREQREFFNPESNKKKLAEDIRKLKIDLLINQLDLMVITKGVETIQTGGQANKRAEKSKTEQTELYLKTQGWKNSIKQLKKIRENSDELLQFFDWKLDFPEVLNPLITEKIGFDIVIANPPYLGEKGFKEKFREIKRGFLKGFYQSKMDIFYFFFHLGLEFIKRKGIITFITTNYFPTADGALKLRKTLKENSNIIQLINFNEYKIFDSALGQHNLITILKKSSKKTPTKVIIVERNNSTSALVLENILSGCDSETSYSYQSEIFEGEKNFIRITSLGDSYENNEFFEKISFYSDKLSSILNINSGCDVTISKITEKHLQNFPETNAQKGDGVFVLNRKEIFELQKNFTKYEKTLIKPFIKNSDISQFFYKKSDLYLLFIDWNENKKNIPNIIEHLTRFKSILKDQTVRYEEPNWPWYTLHRPREQSIFEASQKILVPYRSKINAFALCEEQIFSSRDVFFITNKPGIKFDLHAVNAILNSKLIFYWLFHKGKRKGDTLELYNTPLSAIPISKNIRKHLRILVNKSSEITSLKLIKKNSRKVQTELDVIVYKIYNLTFSEIMKIDPEFSLSREEYENITLEE